MMSLIERRSELKCVDILFGMSSTWINLLLFFYSFHLIILFFFLSFILICSFSQGWNGDLPTSVASAEK